MRQALPTFLAVAALLAGPAFAQEAEPPVSVTLEASAAVPLSDFPTVAMGTVKGVGAKGSWFVTPQPDGGIGSAPLADGRSLLILIKPKPGKYSITFLGQVAAEGEDPIAAASGAVVVGGKAPDPIDPDNPDPPPGPVLTGLAKAVYDAAKGVDKAVLTQAAGAYGSQVSAIGAGAYAGLSAEAAKDKIAAAIQEANPPRNAAPALFDVIDAGLQKLDDAGRFGTLPDVQAALSDVTTGLEAAAR